MKKSDAQLGKPQILFKGTTAELAALSAIEGMLAYDKTLQTIVLYNGSEWAEISGGSETFPTYPVTRTFSSAKLDGIFSYFGTGGTFVTHDNPCRDTMLRGAYFTASQINNQDGTRLAYCATDFSLNADWGCSHTQNTSSAWWKIDFKSGYAMTPNYIGLIGRESAGSHPRNFKIQGSNNDSDWDDLLTIVGDGPSSGTWWTSPITGASAYRYLQLLQTGVNSDGSNYLVIGEIEFWGTLAEV